MTLPQLAPPLLRLTLGLVASFGVCFMGLAIRPPVWEVNGRWDVDRLGVELLLVLMVHSAAVFCLGPGSFSVDQQRERSRAHAA